MTWLILAIISYAILGFTTVGDKYLLSGPIPNPVNYTFCIGMLGLLVLFFTPFLGFPLPPFGYLFASMLSGAFFICALLPLNYGIKKFEASRILPATGGFTPLFTLVFTVFALPLGKSMSPEELVAFALLVWGSITITAEAGKSVISKSLRLALLSSLFFAASFVLSKYVYLNQSFWTGFLWMRIGGGIVALIAFLALRELREKVFVSLKTHPSLPAKKTARLFLGNQTLGASAIVLQSAAVYLAPTHSIAFINALEGIQYAFLLFYLYILVARFPHVFREAFQRNILAKKIFSIVLIILGTAFLAFGGR